ncbi:MAG: ABC transporter permease [Acidimicrobiales bacterium]
MSGFSWRRVRGVLRQDWYVLRHSPMRIMEIVYWPVIEVVLWGFITRYLAEADAGIPGGVGVLLGAVVLWDLAFRSQQELAVTYLMDVWDRSVLNLFASPLRQSEYVIGDMIFSLGRVLVGSSLLVLFARLAFGFDLLTAGAALAPAVVLLLVFGWSLGLCIRAALLRFGSNAEVLAWSVAFLLQPVSAVFYPVSSLPGWLRPVAWAVPAAHVFEAVRRFIADGELLVGHLLAAAALDLVYLAGGALVLAAAYRSVRVKGLLSKPGY